MQEVSTTSEQQKHQKYVTMKISRESRMVLSEIQSNDLLWSHIDVKDIIALAWPKCPRCGGPLTVKFMSQNLVCVRCKTEYSLTLAT
jgi:tRNA(Ile2) C34 agmatinyltransferase TiaS